MTRNSLLALPLALAVPFGDGIVPLVVVTQTVAELLAMVLRVRLVPLLIPERAVRAELNGERKLHPV